MKLKKCTVEESLSLSQTPTLIGDLKVPVKVAASGTFSCSGGSFSLLATVNITLGSYNWHVNGRDPCNVNTQKAQVEVLWPYTGWRSTSIDVAKPSRKVIQNTNNTCINHWIFTWLFVLSLKIMCHCFYQSCSTRIVDKHVGVIDIWDCDPNNAEFWGVAVAFEDIGTITDGVFRLSQMGRRRKSLGLLSEKKPPWLGTK